MQTLQLITFVALIAGLWALPTTNPASPNLTVCLSKMGPTEATCQKAILGHIDPEKAIELGQHMTACCLAYKMIHCIEDAILKEPVCKDSGAFIKGVIEAMAKKEFGQMGCTNFDKCK